MTRDQQPLQRLIDAIEEAVSPAPIFVGIDGQSGSGKSTLASDLAAALRGHTSVLVIEGDDFYTGGSGATWDVRSPEENAGLAMDWRRQRSVLETLRTAGSASWRPFGWGSEHWDRDPPPFGEPVGATAANIIVLEGVYSCRRELHTQLDLRVLLATPEADRRRRLAAREGDAYDNDWGRRWDQAEHHYFDTEMPPGRFDLVL